MNDVEVELMLMNTFKDFVRKELDEPSVKKLWGTAGGTCTMCKKPLSTEASNSGKIYGEHAHIYGLKHTDNRYNPDLNEAFVNSFDNHILLCADCHTIIDKKPLSPEHTADKLVIIKRNHVQEVAIHLGYEISQITFNELEIITRYLMGSMSYNDDLTIIKPSEKIEKNKLSNQTGLFIVQGLQQSGLLSQYLQNNPDGNFATKLKNGVVEKYNELVKAGYAGDYLFNELWSIASRGSYEPKIRAAGLATIAYFFEICDIFEK